MASSQSPKATVFNRRRTRRSTLPFGQRISCRRSRPHANAVGPPAPRSSVRSTGPKPSPSPAGARKR